MGMENDAGALENTLEIPQKDSNHIIQQFYSYVYTKKNENICPQKTCTRMFTAALFIIDKRWKELK